MSLQPKTQNPKPARRASATYKPGLSWFAATGSAWVFVLVLLGAFTTSYNVGMIFPDWPLSNGSLNPDGWLKDTAMFLEHSHRLSGMMMGLISISIAAWVFARESRPWVRRTALFAVILVVVQGIVGGLRVRLEPHFVETVSTSLGRLFAMVHAVLAQVYVCTQVAIATGLSRPWIEGWAGTSSPEGKRLKSFGLWCCGLLLLQLAIAAVMRHSFAGLAIPTFPWSTPEGNLLPHTWDFRVSIHFAHRLMAVLLSAALIAFAVKIFREKALSTVIKQGAVLVLALLLLQIALGAASVWTQRDPNFTTAHVIVGATTLAMTFFLTWLLHRDQLEGATRALVAPAVSRSPSSGLAST